MNRRIYEVSSVMQKDRGASKLGDKCHLFVCLLLAATATAACSSDHGADPGEAGAAGAAGTGSVAGAGGTSGASSGYHFGDPVVLATELALPVRIAQDDASLYVTNRGTVAAASGSVLRVPKAGGDTQSVADHREQPFGVAVQAGTVYWVEGTATAGGVFAAQPGQAPQPMLASVVLPEAIVVDSAHIAWSWGLPPASVEVRNLADMTPVTQLNGMYTSVSELLLDNSRNQIIVMDRGGDESSADIEGRSFDGTQASQILPAGVSVSSISAGTIAGSRLFFTSPSDGRVRSIDLDNETPSVVAQGLSQPWGIAVDDQYAYVTERYDDTASCASNAGTLKAFPLAGGDPVLLAQGLTCPSRIVVDADAVYWVNNGIEDGQNGSVMKVAKQAH